MVKVEIQLLVNNVVLPFQKFDKDYGLGFIKLNRLHATQSLAEHGLGFLIIVYEDDKKKPIKKIIFDTGGPNLTFLHNIDVRQLNINDVDTIILSHWHYDHSRGLYQILRGIENEVQIISHEYAKFERFFVRSQDVEIKDLIGRSRDYLIPLLSNSKLVNQQPIDIDKIDKLNGKVIFSEDIYEILNDETIKIFASGEIPRHVKLEEFNNFISLQNNKIEYDKIMDDKCLILEFENEVIILNGCCHSGIINTINYIKSFTKKPISHIIGGFHMVSASDERLIKTIDFLSSFQDYDNPIYLFPIHCSGERFLNMINKQDNTNILALNASVGTTFLF
jgi:7,8-dihydropterin-6-yl-methyl-4-(beta-D-ribofuranosyl)aminobenzene 5'-phosphate synthase